MASDRQILEEHILLPVTPSMSADLYRLSPRRGDVRGSFLMLPGPGSDKTVFTGADNKAGGLAYFLAEQGYEVFIGLYRGRDVSLRQIRQEKFGLEQIVMEDLPLIWQAFSKRRRSGNVYLIGHRRGGLLLSSFLMRFPEHVDDITGMAFFDTWRKSLPVGWIKYGIDHLFSGTGLRFLCRMSGVCPAWLMPEHTISESFTLLDDFDRWRQSDPWLDWWDDFDYSSVDTRFPPCLYFVADHQIWNRREIDSRELMQELPAHNGRMIRLSRHSGGQRNYRSYDLCRHPAGVNDFYPLMLDWFGELSVTDQSRI